MDITDLYFFALFLICKYENPLIFNTYKRKIEVLWLV
jgi:hypothetical protein